MSLSVLVVDDSDVIRRMISRTPELADISMGSVSEASNGREALALMDCQWIDVVLADLNMPVITGEEMLQHMRNNSATSNIPVIVVSTESCPERVDGLRAEGVYATIQKPFTPEQIRDAIADVLDATSSGADVSIITEALDEVLGGFVMMYGEVATEGSATVLPNGDAMYAHIGFSGPLSGTVSLLVPRPLATQMTANVLATDIDDPDAMDAGGDTVGELLNVLAGRIVLALGEGAPIDLSPPEVVRARPGDADLLAARSGTIGYDIEGYRVLASVTVRSGSPR